MCDFPVPPPPCTHSKYFHRVGTRLCQALALAHMDKYILQSVIDSRHQGEDVIRAVKGFSRFLYWTTPNSDILCYLLEAAKGNIFTVPAQIRPDPLQTLGDIMHMQSDNDGARSAVEEARS